MNDITHKGNTWQLKTKISDQVFKDFDFTETNFNSPIFTNVIFEDCLFKKCNLEDARLFETCNFYNCSFETVDLSHTHFGSSKGIYEKCLFYKCNYKGKHFNFTRFIECMFTKCKIINVDFNASSFFNCKFTGKFDNVSFNGLYDTNKSEFKTLKNVDFSEAEFKDFVSFYECDLSTVIPPKGKTFDELLYQIDRKNPLKLSTGSKDRIVID